MHAWGAVGTSLLPHVCSLWRSTRVRRQGMRSLRTAVLRPRSRWRRFDRACEARRFMPTPAVCRGKSARRRRSRRHARRRRRRRRQGALPSFGPRAASRDPHSNDEFPKRASFHPRWGMCTVAVLAGPASGPMRLEWLRDGPRTAARAATTAGSAATVPPSAGAGLADSATHPRGSAFRCHRAVAPRPAALAWAQFLRRASRRGPCPQVRRCCREERVAETECHPLIGNSPRQRAPRSEAVHEVPGGRPDERRAAPPTSGAARLAKRRGDGCARHLG